MDDDVEPFSAIGAAKTLTDMEIRLLDRLVKDVGKNCSQAKTRSHYLTRIARLGSYLARASDPGNKVMWRELSHTIDVELGASSAQKLCDGKLGRTRTDLLFAPVSHRVNPPQIVSRHKACHTMKIKRIFRNLRRNCCWDARINRVSLLMCAMQRGVRCQCTVVGKLGTLEDNGHGANDTITADLDGS